MIEHNRVYHDDCLAILSRMEDKSVDCFTDPPYNVGKEYGEGVNDKLPEQDYIAWITQVLSELKRVSVNLTVYTPHKWSLLYWQILGPGFQEIIVSYRPSGAIRNGFSNQFARLLTNAKPNTPIRNVWEDIPMPGCGWFFREKTYNHPGYTSLALTQRVIFHLCNSGLPVFDPFCGTGTTLIAAMEYGREFVGCDKVRSSVELTNQRIRQASQQAIFEGMRPNNGLQQTGKGGRSELVAEQQGLFAPALPGC